MGRLSSVHYMTAEEEVKLDRCVRAHRYASLDAMLVDLDRHGIKISRSALHRHAAKLKEKDALCAGPEETTIVSIIERSTGEIRVLRTHVSGAVVAALIEELGAVSCIS